LSKRRNEFPAREYLLDAIKLRFAAITRCAITSIALA
jgi:hypothetical protein